MEQTERRRSLVFPLLLIAAGVIFLLSNIGLVTGSIWDFLFRYWPLLLIIGGLDAIYKREGLFGPVFLVSLGTILLLLNLGYASWEIWGIFFGFWPLLLILAGISIIFHRSLTTWWGAILTLLIVCGVAGLIILFGSHPVFQGVPFTSESVQEPVGSSRQASITLSPSTGMIFVHAGTDPSQLIGGSVHPQVNEQIEQSNLSQGDTAIYSIRSRGDWRVPTLVRHAPPSWDLSLSPTIPINLTFNLGAGSANLDLSNLKISGLKINAAVGSLSVTLPESGNFSGEINGAVGQMTIYVPAKLNVEIHATGGLSSVDVPPQFTRSGNDIRSPQAAASATTSTLRINQAIGGLVIRMLP